MKLYSQLSLCFISHLQNRQCHDGSYMTKRDDESRKDDDAPHVKPPSSFDPSIFDQFDLGGWSTNINNPYVAATYVKARQGMEQKNRQQDKKSITADPSKKNNLDENEQSTLERLMTRDEKAILERRKAWERARAEEKDD